MSKLFDIETEYEVIKSNIRTCVARWISKNADEKKLRRKIYAYMDKNMKNMIPTLLGMKQTWDGGWRISDDKNNNNFIWTEMQDKIQTLAKQYVNEAVTNLEKEELINSSQFCQSVKDQTKKDLIQRIKWDTETAIRKRTEAKREELAEKIASELLHEIDNIDVKDFIELLERE